MARMDLEQNNYYELTATKYNRKSADRCRLKGPLRVFRLCLLAVLLPGLLIAVPLYLRYRVYSEHVVPLGMSDMRLVDNKISTTWCQRQLVTSNATFNAYLLSENPALQHRPKFVNLMREIVLEDDMKEYWGFYLLKGSTVTVSSCSRRPGASLIIIKGHHHLRHCAYIGDNSSEEEEEMEEIKLKNEENNKYSIPKHMTRIRPDVKLANNNTNEEYFIKKDLDVNEKHDEFDYRLHQEHREIMRKGQQRLDEKPNADSMPSGEVFKTALKKLRNYKTQGKEILGEVKKRLGNENDDESLKLLINILDNNDGDRQRRHIKLVEQLSTHDEDANNAEEEGVEHNEVRGTINGTTANDTSNSEFWSSFSSSEERLLECDGLILSQPLIPSPLCRRKSSPDEIEKAIEEQKISYTVPTNGYYFFVYSSENEIQPNYIRAHFELEKKLYNVSNAIASCENSTGECSLSLNFFSHERLVLELPINESLWNNEFLVVSTCEPRTAIYVACIIAVPILILLCAF